MSNELSPLQQMMEGVEKQLSNVIRDLHLSVLNYIAGQIEKAYLKYKGSLVRAAKYVTTSADKNYKTYLTLRGNALLARYQLAQ